MAPTTRTRICEPSHLDLPEPWRRLRAAYLVEKQSLSGSRRTATEYAKVLDRFLEGVADPAAVRPLDIEVFAYGPGSSGAVPTGSTICVRLAALSGYFQLAHDNGLVAANPAAPVRRPKALAPLPRGVEPDAIRRLLAAIPDHPAGRRDRALVLLITLTALRRSEALGLRAGDLDWRRGEFTTRVKGGCERRRVLPEPVLEAIRAALAAEGRVLETLAPDERLFRVSGSGFGANLRRHAATAGVVGVCPHALRHSAAQLRRLAGASLEQVGALLGHQSIAVTATYLRRLETEPDRGWRDVVGVLGLAQDQVTSAVATGKVSGPTEVRPAWHPMVWARSRAGPAMWKATGRALDTRPVQAIGGSCVHHPYQQEMLQLETSGPEPPPIPEGGPPGQALRIVRENGESVAQCPRCGERLRFGRVAGQVIRTPRDLADLLVDEMSTLEREELRVALLNTKNRVLAVETVYLGNVSAALVRVGELFTSAIRMNAAGVILVHNHPSGDPTPSPDDLHLTAEALAAGRLLDIELLDHIVVGGGTFVSLRDRGIAFSRSGNHRAGEASRLPPWRNPLLANYRSALQKHIRRAEINKAVAVAQAMLGMPGGRSALARRLPIVCVEDVGIDWIPDVGRTIAAVGQETASETTERLLGVTAALASLPKDKSAYHLADSVWMGRHKPREVSAAALLAAIAAGDHKEALAVCLGAIERRQWRSGARLIDVMTGAVANGPERARAVVHWSLWREAQGGSGTEECVAASVIAAVDRLDGPAQRLPAVTYERPVGPPRLAWYCADPHTPLGAKVAARHARRLGMTTEALSWLWFNEESLRLGPAELPSRWKDEALALDAIEGGWGTPKDGTRLWVSIRDAIRADIEEELGR